jgi:hypothetical protein
MSAMSALDLEGLRPEVSTVMGEFLREVLGGYGENIHSIHVVGSAVTEDFRPGASDINSIFVLREMDLGFLGFIAPRGKKYARKRVAAPLIMTPAYIENSLDVFPVEFLSFKLIHRTVYGEDILADLSMAMEDLRQQCERELKGRLVGLRQGYISALGDSKAITENLMGSISGYMPLFRGVLMLLGKEPPAGRGAVLDALSAASGVDCGVFEMVLRQKAQRTALSAEQLDSVFADYYGTTERLMRIVDEIKI